MRIIKRNENTFIFLIPMQLFNKVKFDDKKNLEIYFQDFFLKLKDIYKFNIGGFYIIDIYVDDNYGAILEVTKEDIDYFEYLNSSIDMKVSKPKKVKFLYEIEDLFLIDKKILNKFDIYFYKNKYYLNLVKKINKKELIILLEFVDIIYESENVLKNGKLVKIET